MILQSSNKPILVEMVEDVEGLPIRATLWSTGIKLKEWDENTIVYNDKLLSLPLKQEETKEFKKGTATLEIKWLLADGSTEFAEPIQIEIVSRFDKEILNVES